MTTCPQCGSSYADNTTRCAKCGFAASRVIAGRYELVSPLGSGGMAAVYRARDINARRDVAVKILGKEFAASDAALERLRRELSGVAALHHPNLVAIYDFGSEPEASPYVVMELVEGWPLNTILREGRVDVESASRVMYETCAGVGAAHERGFVHTDLKPNNIIITPSGLDVKVLNFGTARLRHRIAQENEGFAGTPQYMSPEQWQGKEIDARSDVYSLGVTFYEMLAGHAPFTAPSMDAIAIKHLTSEPPPLPEDLRVGGAIEAVIMRALSKDPTDRQRDANALARELREASLSDLYYSGPAMSISSPAMTEAAGTPEQRPAELKAPVGKPDEALESHDLAAECHRYMEWTSQTVERYGQPADQRKFELLKRELTTILESDSPNPAELQRNIDQMDDLRMSLLVTRPEWWINVFTEMEDRRYEMTDQALAEQLFNQGRRAIAYNDLEGLKVACRQLIYLLPLRQQQHGPFMSSVDAETSRSARTEQVRPSPPTSAGPIRAGRPPEDRPSSSLPETPRHSFSLDEKRDHPQTTPSEEIDDSGWGNREIEYYTNAERNAHIDDQGNLVISPIKETPLEEKEGTKRPIYLDENVQFTLYRPKTIAPQKWYTMLAFAHLGERPPDAPEDEPDPIEQMRDEAERVLGREFGSYRDTSIDSPQAIPRSGEITFVPFAEGVEFNPASRTFVWEESVHSEKFRLRASPSMQGRTARGRLSIFLGSILLAEIPLSLSVDGARASTAAPKERASAQPYRKIFPSYSHADRAIVEQIEHFAQLLGDKYLRDVIELRSGQNWKKWMKKAIHEADIFQLFWSRNSMRSRYVREEWEYALSLQRDHFVRPTYWETPLPESQEEGLPPEALRDLHFQHVNPLMITHTTLHGDRPEHTASARAARTESASVAGTETPRRAEEGERLGLEAETRRKAEEEAARFRAYEEARGRAEEEHLRLEEERRASEKEERERIDRSWTSMPLGATRGRAAPRPEQVICQACQTPHAPGTRFCGRCGSTISYPVTAPQAGPNMESVGGAKPDLLYSSQPRGSSPMPSYGSPKRAFSWLILLLIFVLLIAGGYVAYRLTR